VIFCADKAIRTLNARYRNIDRPTDVLSFTMNDPDLLGEIVISLPKVRIQAKRYGVSNDDEIARLFVHGFFHLLGFDHKNKKDRRVMENREQKYLD
jgi:probable rRNA maturation factor